MDVINGGALLREGVDVPAAEPQDLDKLTEPDEGAWLGERQSYFRY